jgi:hypothetical protein
MTSSKLKSMASAALLHRQPTEARKRDLDSVIFKRVKLSSIMLAEGIFGNISEITFVLSLYHALY